MHRSPSAYVLCFIGMDDYRSPFLVFEIVGNQFPSLANGTVQAPKTWFILDVYKRKRLGFRWSWKGHMEGPEVSKWAY